MTPSKVRKLLNRYKIYPDKKKGQNFLTDDSYINIMTQAAGIAADDLVYEIGPGLGVLTRRLAEEAGAVLAIELDNKLFEYLRASVGGEYNTVSLVHGDALSKKAYHWLVEWLYAHKVPSAVVDPKAEEYGEIIQTVDHGYKLVANLPYQITSRILRDLLENVPRPLLMVVMVQKEVAERMTAQPGKMSLLSLSVQALSKAELIEVVPASAFYPEPEVESAIVRLDLVRPDQDYERLDEQQKKIFWRLARAGFSSRRKMLKNNLSAVRQVDSGKINSGLRQAGISPAARAQELSVRQWSSLAGYLQD